MQMLKEKPEYFIWVGIKKKLDFDVESQSPTFLFIYKIYKIIFSWYKNKMNFFKGIILLYIER